MNLNINLNESERDALIVAIGKEISHIIEKRSAYIARTVDSPAKQNTVRTFTERLRTLNAIMVRLEPE